MGINWERAIIAALVALLFGIVYGAITHFVYQKAPEHPYTALFVVFGVSLTMGAAAIVVPIQWVVVMAVLFAITGLPQILTSMYREERRRRQLLEDARRQISDTLK